jgi:hypothetical protein
VAIGEFLESDCRESDESNVAGPRYFEGHSLGAKEYLFYDHLNEVRYIRAGDEMRGVGLFVRREPFEAHIFDVSPISEP